MTFDFQKLYRKIQAIDEGLQDTNGLEFNGKEVDLNSISLGNVDTRDYPDFSDAYVEYAEYTDGTPLSDSELDAFTDMHGDIVNQLAHDRLHEGKRDPDTTPSEWDDEVKEDIIDECGPMPGMPNAAQTDSVTMNVTMNGSGANGIRDLMNVLKDIQDGPDGEMGHEEPDADNMGGPSDHDMDNMDSHMDMDVIVAKKPGMDAMTLDSVSTRPDEKYYPTQAMFKSGTDLHGNASRGDQGNRMDGPMPRGRPTTEGLIAAMQKLYTEVKLR